MFSRKRHFYEKKTFYAAVFTAFTLVLSLSLWMSGEPLTESDPVDQTIDQAVITGQGAVQKPIKPEYFVVEEDQYIKVYFTDENGVKNLIRTTDISFDLLGAEDQELFRNGVRLENEDQLMELLQDFES